MKALSLTSRGASPNRIWLGGAAFGRWGNRDWDSCAAVIRGAFDRGVNAFDTAQLYSDGESEEILGRALAPIREDVFIATKFGYAPESFEVNEITRALELSLRRLSTDRVDLFQLHRVPPPEKLAGALKELSALVDSGKVRAIGASGRSSAGIRESQALAVDLGLHPLISEQSPYSIFVREIERDLIATCRHSHVAMLAYAPLNGSFLTGKYDARTPPPSGTRAANWPMRASRFNFERPELTAKLRLAEQLKRLAQEADMTLIELSLRFALSNRALSAVIVGARHADQLAAVLPQNADALEPDVLSAIDNLVAPGETIDSEDIVAYRTDGASNTVER